MSIEALIKTKQSRLISKDLQTEAELQKHQTNLIENKLELLNKVKEKLIEKYSIDNINSINEFHSIRDEAWAMIEHEAEKNILSFYIDSHDKAELFERLIQTMFGYGILDPLINDPSTTEIMVNGIDNIFIEKDGKIMQATNSRGENLKFNNEGELLYVIEKIVAPINRKVDESNPIVDARLPNGFRVNIVLNAVSLDGSVITIRKFPEHPFTMDDLVKFGTLPSYVAEFLEKLVKARYNIIVSGGTGTGKTTFLNALSNYIENDARVITIEDSAELKLTKIKNLIRLETRPPNVEGKGEISMRNLVKSALRMRPDRIVVGEVRGGEALDMLQAMNTGHDGSLSTGHANSSGDMLSRLETMVLMSGVELPLKSIRQQIASAVEFIVHLSKLQDGSRRVVQITEILGVNNDGYITQNIFEFKRAINSKEIIGQLTYTGNQIKRANKLLFSEIEPIEFNKLLKQE